MAVRERVRIGGRSARIQTAVHAAVRELTAEADRGELTVPMIAARAGVTPSTIYRRWGDLPSSWPTSQSSGSGRSPIRPTPAR